MAQKLQGRQTVTEDLIAYRKYRPQAGARTVIEQANQIIADAEADGWHSMTLRQLYYQFVSRGFIPNAVSEYKRLGRIVTDARYGGLIGWRSIEDAGRNSYHFPENPTAEQVLNGIEYKLSIDPWADQDTYVEVWVEKQALEATIARPAGRLNTPYMACKGYLSASEAWRASLRYQRAIAKGKNPVLLHLGDHDPSGIDMTRDNADRLAEFLGGRIEVRRIALNMDQVEEYAPPPNPAKEDDSRYPRYQAEFGDESWELDALRQNTIGDIITENLKSFINQEKWDASMAEQERRRRPLAKLKRRWSEVEQLLDREDNPMARLKAFEHIDPMNMSTALDGAERVVRAHDEDNNWELLQEIASQSKTALGVKYMLDDIDEALHGGSE